MMARRWPSQAAAAALEEPLAGFPEVAGFAVSPHDVTCRQGAHAYVARCVAARQERVLFHDPQTRQLGVGRVQGDEVVDATQYPFARVAVLMFLGRVEALESE